MNKTRLEAFSDGVIAIIITIMVLELPEPEGTTWEALRADVPVLLAYALSFVYLGIYWTNHHHMFAAVRVINGAALWANLHLLFWLSLIPFVTSWMGENHYEAVPTALYGVVLFCCAIAYTILLRTILSAQRGANSRLAAAVGDDRKGKLSLLMYAMAIPLAFVHQSISHVLYAMVALIWLVPDTRIESRMQSATEGEPAA